jgi:hypothetical protein
LLESKLLLESKNETAFTSGGTRTSETPFGRATDQAKWKPKGGRVADRPVGEIAGSVLEQEIGGAVAVEVAGGLGDGKFNYQMAVGQRELHWARANLRGLVNNPLRFSIFLAIA